MMPYKPVVQPRALPPQAFDHTEIYTGLKLLKPNAF
jgi:hypothetical protein